jgi:hypothetical protein
VEVLFGIFLTDGSKGGAPQKKNKKKVCDPQKNFSRWCSRGALGIFLTHGFKRGAPQKKNKKKLFEPQKNFSRWCSRGDTYRRCSQKKKKKKVCDPPKNFSGWWHLSEVLRKKKIKKKYVIHKKTLVGGALQVLFGIFLRCSPKKK